MWLFKLNFHPLPLTGFFFPGLLRVSAEGKAQLPPPRSPHGAAGDASPAPLPVGAAGAHRAEPGWTAEANGHWTASPWLCWGSVSRHSSFRCISFIGRQSLACASQPTVKIKQIKYMVWHICIPSLRRGRTYPPAEPSSGNEARR